MSGYKGYSSSQTSSSTKYECSLHGSVSSESVWLLKDRLDAICGGTEAGKKRLERHELFKPIVETPFGPLRKNDALLFLRTQYSMSDPEQPQIERISLIQYGSPETRTNRAATIRPISSSTIYSGDGHELLQNLQYEKFSDHLRNGFWYFFENTASISLYQIYKNDGNCEIFGPEESLVSSDAWVIEVSIITENQDTVAKAVEMLQRIKLFLKGTAELVVLGHLYTQTKVPYSLPG
ncbi:hypothetical protein BB561_005573 [Smittium simulii]|uniref:Mediator of RNA polymerase II transcription subunit 18 n=1 Tax=Smittium simulii TaxID=133385 RepID=A0A2T9Y9Q1_9FUNG|nr:hypothetical protein BB561_005573 [Smittium simulii]